MTMTRLQSPVLVFAFALACGRAPDRTPASTATPPAGMQATPPSIDGAWNLTSLGDSNNVRGAGDRAITLTVKSDSTRVAGFAGCNQYGGSYTVAGDSIKFGALMSTKMACPGWPMQLETSYLAALSDATTFSVSDSVLVLNRRTGAALRFSR
jgi:heat shock protein HslJ